MSNQITAQLEANREADKSVQPIKPIAKLALPGSVTGKPSPKQKRKVRSQSATLLAKSTVPKENWDFAGAVERTAKRKSAGATRERHMLNFQKLVSSVCAEYRMHHAGEYGRTERLPTEIHGKIQTLCQEYIQKQLAQVHVGNVLSVQRRFFHKWKDSEIVERVTATGENVIALKEQLLGVKIFIGQTEKRLKDCEAKPTPDYDREASIKESLAKLNRTKLYVESEIAHQEKLAIKEKLTS